ncbi:biopolymer transporter ExbD [Sulfuritalea sp.]|uniref:ExbD/TolR family protein n=1 Tax=Sulfuritalea sp. TaxID=2480090 RepID=UPI001ACA9786|nr:biopolymer transporter ExbD [Sulfuritalea sp.]MBN8476660.1 biopolymer transporter ExbD [Sulfuritalea sp.]
MAFGSFSEGGTPQPMGEINTTPLVDVMLVLLVIFIITIPAMHQAVPIDLPQVSSQKVEDKPVVIQLALDADGRYFLDGAPAHRADFEAHFAATAARNPELHLRADRGTRYENVADILAAAQKAGINRIAFVTESKK